MSPEGPMIVALADSGARGWKAAPEVRLADPSPADPIPPEPNPSTPLAGPGAPAGPHAAPTPQPSVRLALGAAAPAQHNPSILQSPLLLSSTPPKGVPQAPQAASPPASAPLGLAGFPCPQADSLTQISEGVCSGSLLASRGECGSRP
eukprot:CAMPEP_0184305940 /NCGR_PEP_ID=MMETSP1049-20130417/15074_1 /TAXON_ID=77928 /ORGANISM="Proteomonas sulcata, Strain CCMP704" /LENGTH=147 /DNA_ID=CAMNT_0026618099 /DNA_START=1915 /DNA_END=2359 /DNA_ORIENTATION=+